LLEAVGIPSGVVHRVNYALCRMHKRAQLELTAERASERSHIRGVFRAATSD